MSFHQSQLILGVSNHWLLGSLPLDDLRIQDRLNDSRSDFVKLTDVEIHPLATRKCVAKLPSVVVPKSKIEFAGTPSPQHEAPEQRLNHFERKNTCEVSAILGRYRISGALHLPEFTGDGVHALSHQLARFFPVTEATLMDDTDSRACFALLIANKDFVTCFHVGSPRQGETQSAVLDCLHDLTATQ